MKELIEDIVKALVDDAEQVSIGSIESQQITILEVRVAPADLGKVIGKRGRTVKSIRTILRAGGMKLKKGFVLEIHESTMDTTAPESNKPLRQNDSN